jgi:hypothetical protein
MGGVAGSQGGSMAQSPYSAPKIPVPAVKRGSPVHKRGGSERYEYIHIHVQSFFQMRLC